MIRQAPPFSNIMNVKWLLMLCFFIMLTPGFSQTTKDKEKLQRTKQKLEEEIRYTTDLLEKTQKNKQTSQ